MKKLTSMLLAVLMALAIVAIPAGAEGVPFTDIGNLDAYTQDNIAYLYQQGIMNGTSETTFDPEVMYTRAMFVTMLGRTVDVDPADYPASAFSDVPAGRWDAPYIAWAAEQGIVNGVGDGKFNPTGIITTEQYATIVCRFLDRYEITLCHSDLDGWPYAISDLDEAAPYARESIQRLVEAGILDFGWYEDTPTLLYVNPKVELSREAIAYSYGDLHYIIFQGESLTYSVALGSFDTWAQWSQ